MANVTIYTSPTCSVCTSAKKFFKEKNISFVEYNVTEDTAKAEEIAKKSGATVVPIIDIDGTIIAGFDQKRIAQMLGIN